MRKWRELCRRLTKLEERLSEIRGRLSERINHLETGGYSSSPGKGLVAFQFVDWANEEAAVAGFATLEKRMTIQEKRLDDFAPISQERGKKLICLEKRLDQLFSGAVGGGNRVVRLEEAVASHKAWLRILEDNVVGINAGRYTDHLASSSKQSEKEPAKRHGKHFASIPEQPDLEARLNNLDQYVIGVNERSTVQAEEIIDLKNRIDDSHKRMNERLAVQKEKIAGLGEKIHSLCNRAARGEQSVASLSDLLDRQLTTQRERGDVQGVRITTLEGVIAVMRERLDALSGRATGCISKLVGDPGIGRYNVVRKIEPEEETKDEDQGNLTPDGEDPGIPPSLPDLLRGV